MRKTGRTHDARKRQTVLLMQGLDKPLDVFEINRARKGDLRMTMAYVLDLADVNRIRMVGIGLDAWQQKYEVTEEDKEDAIMEKIPA